MDSLPPNPEDSKKSKEKIEKVAKKKNKKELAHDSKKNKNKIGIFVFIFGLITLVSGVVFLLVNLLAPPMVQDAEFLVNIGKWQLQDDSSVVWNFTEVGKGKLTNNSYLNEYDFIWAIKDDELKIETDWLYTLNDSYSYKLDQGAKTLTLNEDIVLIPLDLRNEAQQESPIE